MSKFSNQELLSQAGEHKFNIAVPNGNLEAILTIPANPNYDFIAVVCHPHSLHGGTMNNKVVTTIVRTFRDLSIPCLRFNFRGVGNSDGVFDNGVGEAEDLRAVLKWISKEVSDADICLAGFSFGSYVSYQLSSYEKLKLLITVAPPVHHYDYESIALPTCPWVIIQGDKDDVVPPQEVYDWIDTISRPLNLLQFPDADHFFHGKLIELRERLQETIKEAILSHK